jgi:hypothetical protein
VVRNNTILENEATDFPSMLTVWLILLYTIPRFSAVCSNGSPVREKLVMYENRNDIHVTTIAHTRQMQ